MTSKPPLLTSKHSQAYSALSRWDPTQPAPLNRAELSTAIAELSASLKPATDQQYAEAMLSLIEFVTAFGIPCLDPNAAQRIYHEALKHLPDDLMNLAITRIRANYTWGSRMPFPAEISAKVAEELAHRKTLLSRAKVALLKALEPEAVNNVISAERWKELRQKLSKTTE